MEISRKTAKKSAKKTKWMKKEERKTSILNTAVELFSKRGVVHTTMKDIATEEGISEAAVYKYFKNKTAIFEEIVNKGLALSENMWKNFEENIDKLSDDPYSTLYSLIKEFWNFAVKYRKILVIMMKEFYDPNLKPIFEKIMKNRTAAEVLTTFFRSCQKKGKIKDNISPELIAYIFISASKPAIGATGYLEEGFKYNHNIEKNITEFLRLFFEGIKADNH